MPIRIGKGPKEEPEFRFHVMDGDKGERVYRLMQTVVRRIRAPGEPRRNPRMQKLRKPSGALILEFAA